MGTFRILQLIFESKQLLFYQYFFLLKMPVYTLKFHFLKSRRSTQQENAPKIKHFGQAIVRECFYKY